MSITPPAPDDPFAALKQSGGTSTPEPLATQPDLPHLETSAGQFGSSSGLGPQRRRISLRWLGVLVVLAVVVSVGVGLVSAGRAIWSAVDETVETATQPVQTQPVQPGQAAAGEAEDASGEAPAKEKRKQGVGDGGSLWKPANLKDALAQMRRAAAGAKRIASLRVDTDYLVAEYAYGKHRIMVYANRDGRVEAQSRRIGSPSDKSIATRHIDPAAPQRIARRIARLAHTKVSHVDYVVLWLVPGQKAQWIGFLDEEANYDAQLNPFYAELDGSGVRANGPKARH